MSTGSPKISVITVCRNAEATIRHTISSVIEQTYGNLEYVIIDGNSTDNTLAVIREFEAGVDTFVSEADSGIYDAMNKGIARATGEYLFFLNADDRFLHHRVIEMAVTAFSPIRPDIIYGDMLHLNSITGAVHYRPQKNLNKIHVLKNMPCQPTVFYNKSCFERCGLFRTDFRIAGDFAWMVNATLRNNVSLQYIPVVLNLFSSGGVSSARHDTVLSVERAAVHREFFTSWQLSCYSFVSRYIRSATTIPVLSDFLNLFLRFRLRNRIEQP